MNNPPFQPAWWARGGHRQSILATKQPSLEVPGPVEILHAPIEGGGRLQIKLSRPQIPAVGTMLIAHGLAGSAESSYVRWLGCAALERGWCVARLDLRGCGGTEALSLDSHNASQSVDIGASLARLDQHSLPRPFAAAGFSLGGNLVLRYMGLAGKSALADLAAAVSPPVDLAACSRAIGAPRNLLYRAYFLTRLCRLVYRAREHFEVIGPAAPSLWNIRTIWRFDELFTAPNSGFSSAAEYYAEASSNRTLGGVQRPTLVLAAHDDPFVPIQASLACHASASADVAFVHPSRGGHVGFRQSGHPRFWAVETMLRFFEE